jgi:hypothetical protein
MLFVVKKNATALRARARANCAVSDGLSATGLLAPHCHHTFLLWNLHGATSSLQYSSSVQRQGQSVMIAN